MRQFVDVAGTPPSMTWAGRLHPGRGRGASVATIDKAALRRRRARAARLDPNDIEAARTNALTVFGLMVGTLQLARALTDRDLSDRLLNQGVATTLKMVDDFAGYETASEAKKSASAAKPHSRPVTSWKRRVNPTRSGIADSSGIVR